MDLKLIIKAACGIGSIVIGVLVGTHNMSAELAANINAGLLGVLAFFGANDHNTSK